MDRLGIEALSELVKRTELELVSQKNFFTGVNPFVIRHLYATDGELAPDVESAEMTKPWLWDFGPRVYLVCAIVVRRRNV